LKKIPYSRQNIDSTDLNAVMDAMVSDFITQGPLVENFEDAVAFVCNCKKAVAVNSGTSALHLACLALDIRPGDEVWTSPNSFVASANCALYCGANIDFVDIDPQTYCLSVSKLAQKLESRHHSGGLLPKVVIPVHFAGVSCDMREVSRLAVKYGFMVIEDASHAIGGRYEEWPVGSCKFSDITVFSFHPVKTITTGEGGMALTNNSALANQMRNIRSHGITRDEQKMTDYSHGPWYYQMIALGFNYRMTDIQAALGLSQLQRLDQFVKNRNQLAARYVRLLVDKEISKHEISWQLVPNTVFSAYHLMVIRLPANHRRTVFEFLRMRGIDVGVHYIPIHLQPYYQALGFFVGQFPEAERHYSECISLPLFPNLPEEKVDEVIDALKRALMRINSD